MKLLSEVKSAGKCLAYIHFFFYIYMVFNFDRISVHIVTSITKKIPINYILCYSLYTLETSFFKAIKIVIIKSSQNLTIIIIKSNINNIITCIGVNTIQCSPSSFTSCLCILSYQVHTIFMF